DTAKVGSNVRLIVTASVGGISRSVQTLLASTGLVDKAVYTTQDVFNVSAKDSLGNVDDDLKVSLADSIPSIDLPALYALSTVQENDESGTFQPNNGYPNGSFYRPDGVTPNVTHCSGNLRVRGNRTVWGIFVVEGWVRIDGNAQVNGIIYVVNDNTTTIHGGGNPSTPSILGGIVSNGDIMGTGNHVYAQHWPEFMRVFCGFMRFPDGSGYQIVSWEYL
ncbi:MAG: hypothetical protein ABIL68_15585, partial [bacterium]